MRLNIQVRASFELLKKSAIANRKSKIERRALRPRPRAEIDYRN